ncbi:uncharacterized protein VTP21DRAFT_4748 [Calcarisporiella thermophila]|uniref:uncharacterized protein n=1 Tax=Calcarisporiella thermophila TaxID=911321 RepID=UPI003743D1A1
MAAIRFFDIPLSKDTFHFSDSSSLTKIEYADHLLNRFSTQSPFFSQPIKPKPLPLVDLDHWTEQSELNRTEKSSTVEPTVPLGIREYSLGDAICNTGIPAREDYVKKDELLSELLIVKAVAEAEKFEVLSEEEAEKLRDKYEALESRLEVLSARLVLQMKIRRAAHTLTRLETPDLQDSNRVWDEFADASKHVDETAAEMWALTYVGRGMHRRLTEHTAGMLARAVKRLEERIQVLESQKSCNEEMNVEELQLNIALLESQLDDYKMRVETLEQELSSSYFKAHRYSGAYYENDLSDFREKFCNRAELSLRIENDELMHEVSRLSHRLEAAEDEREKLRIQTEELRTRVQHLTAAIADSKTQALFSSFNTTSHSFSSLRQEFRHIISEMSAKHGLGT